MLNQVVDGMHGVCNSVIEVCYSANNMQSAYDETGDTSAVSKMWLLKAIA